MVTKLQTFNTLADFEALGKRIKSGIGNSMELIQIGSVAAMEHIEKHGNVAVLEPIASAVGAYLSKSLALKWRAWAIAHSWFTFNPNNLKGARFASATFAQLWVKTKGKPMDVGGMKTVKWFAFEVERDEREVKPIEINGAAAKLVKMLQTALNEGKAVDNDGKTRMSAADVRSIFKHAIEGLTEPHKVTEVAAATKSAKVRNAAKEVRSVASSKVQAAKAKPAPAVAKAA